MKKIGSPMQYIQTLTVAILLLCANAFAQRTAPPFVTDSIFETITPIALEVDYTEQNHIDVEKSPIRPAHHLQLNFERSSHGNWYRYNPGYRTWVLKIRIEEAKAIGLVISNVRLGSTAKLYISNGNVVKGPFEQNNVPRSGIIPIDHLSGNEIAIEFNVPENESDPGDFRIETLSILKTTSNSSSREKTDSCYPCLAGTFFSRAKRSVVKITTFRQNESVMCTGVLINNTLSNAKPYILTANHCLLDQDDVDRAVFTFNFDAADCGGIPRSDYASLIGGELLATSYAHDFSLVELEHPVPVSLHPYFAGWDLGDDTGRQISCIHHPQAGVKEVSIQNDAAEVSNYDVEGKDQRAENAFWHVKNWDVGVTEAGSSGAPLFNQDQRIVGTLSGGSSRCGAPFNDYFQRISESWTHDDSPSKQLKHWLDPNFSGATTIDGFDPLAGNGIECDTLSNRLPAEAIGVFDFGEGGYFSGCNNQGITEFAERFLNRDSSSLTGFNFSVGNIDHNSPGGITVSVKTVLNGVPGETIFERYLSYSSLKWYSNYVDIFPGVAVPPEFFITYLPGCSDGNNFAIEQTEWRESGSNTAWIKRSSVWEPMSQLHENHFGSSLLIDAILCNIVKPDSPTNGSLEMTLRPNPATSQLIGSISVGATKQYTLHVFDAQGQQKQVEVSIYDDHFLIDVSNLSPGLYFIRVATEEKMSVRRFVKH